MKIGRTRLLLGLPAVMVAAALSWGVLSACNIGDPFAAYTGVNFIAGSDFSSSAWTIAYQNGMTPPYPYLTFTPATGTTNGLPSGASDLHLLDIPNLVPGGDFESTTAGSLPAGWSYTTTAAPFVTASATDGAIDRQSLHFVTDGNGHTVRYDLSTSGDLADNFPANAQYRILFTANGYAGNALTFEYDDGTSVIYSVPPWTLSFGTTAPTTYSTPASFPPSGTVSEITAPASGARYFAIGTVSTSGGSATGNIDNLRITRVDVVPYLELEVPYGTGSSSHPAFISGTYEFSLYAKLQDSAQVTPNVANAFDADGITLGIDNDRAELPASSLSRSQWTKVSVKTSSPIQVSTSPASNDIVMQLLVMPTEWDNRDVGGLLISSPSLTFLPNG